jgi:tRNA U34 5-methylaminomethyl-2-thiouridine-forming methyltransferase MnmC
MHSLSHATAAQLAPHFEMTRYLCDLRSLALPIADVVYMDAFAPDKQPELWDSSVFRKLFDCLTPGGLLTTYSAKGSVRRTMQAVGFDVKKLPGPPGKRQMLQALKPKP